ncbi:MAG: MerR family transcriptional regulator [Saprospiraceae bacterium]|nr:MerR family transcriptional regulator [Saprospiraceae bacterium]
MIIHHNLDETFIENLETYQLIKFVVHDTDKYLLEEQLPVLEQIIRLHYDLQINMEGIDVITHMLGRMENMQQTIQQLEKKLRLYEHSDD